MEIVKIDLVPSGVMPSCHASQYDIGREIRFLLTDGGEEYTLAGTETISIELRKPDGTSETIAIPNTSSNYVDWETSDGELDLSGVYLAEISIKNGDDVLGSANFIVKTEADAYDGADVRTITVGPADICTFETTLPEPLQSVIVDVQATGGNGTPDNPNPINGYTEANITANGDVITIAFGQTVYGGVLDVTRGKLHVTHAGVNLSDLNWVSAGSSGTARFQTTSISPKTIEDNYTTPDFKCSHYRTLSWSNVGSEDKFITQLGGDTPIIAIVNQDYSDVNTFKASLSGAKLVYELATPFDIDLTPEVISAVVGTNNVFADCGQTTVKYLKAGA
jgi:hypothetical protein